MQLIHIKGNTWYIDADQLICAYINDNRETVLIDCGWIEQRDALEKVLWDNGLILKGIIATHAHSDHSGNLSYFQDKYGIETCLPLGEAALSFSISNLKHYFSMFTVTQLENTPDFRSMVVIPTNIIMPGDTSVTIAGMTFGILHTPGHSPDHIAVMTPDEVLFLGDVLMTNESFDNAKMPYHAVFRDTFITLEAMRNIKAAYYIVSHRGVHEEIESWIDANIEKINVVSMEILSMIDKPMLMDEIYGLVCRHYKTLSGKYTKANITLRNIKTYVEYLIDASYITSYADQGLIYYAKKEEFPL